VRRPRAAHDEAMPGETWVWPHLQEAVLQSTAHEEAIAMIPYLSTDYRLFKLEHDLRIADAQRRRRAEQAARAHPRHRVATAIGKRAGIVLVAMGERLQGMSHGAPDPDPAVLLQPGDHA
jgi:hypothetical protein